MLRGIWCGRFHIRPGAQALKINLDSFQPHSQVFVHNFVGNIDKKCERQVSNNKHVKEFSKSVLLQFTVMLKLKQNQN